MCMSLTNHNVIQPMPMPNGCSREISSNLIHQITLASENLTIDPHIGCIFMPIYNLPHSYIHRVIQSVNRSGGCSHLTQMCEPTMYIHQSLCIFMCMSPDDNTRRTPARDKADRRNRQHSVPGVRHAMPHVDKSM